MYKCSVKQNLQNEMAIYKKKIQLRLKQIEDSQAKEDDLSFEEIWAIKEAKILKIETNLDI